MFQLNPTFKGKKNCLGKVVQVDDYSIYADLRKKKIGKNNGKSSFQNLENSILKYQ